MSCSLHRATSTEIDQLIRDPSGVGRFLGLDDGPPVREVKPKGLLGLLLRLTPITITEVDSDADWTPTNAAGPGKSIEIDKAWHGLHFLFTGLADGGREPACYLNYGGEDLDDEGQTRALRPGQARQFAEFLSALTTSDLAQRYDAARMTTLEIYPYDTWPPSTTLKNNPVTWLTDAFKEVREFARRAADAGDGLIINIA
jgi:uncharacterized protein DUF1877